MKCPCFTSITNLPEEESHTNKLNPAKTIRTLFFKKWAGMVCLFLAMQLNASVFAVDKLYVSGIPDTHATANGEYSYNGDKYGYNSWIYTNGSNTYYICHDNEGYWDFCTNIEDPVASFIYTSFDQSFITSPTGITNWCNNQYTEPPLQQNLPISVKSPQPEINVSGNSKSIDDGSTSPSFSNYTKFGEVNYTSGIVERTFTISNAGLTPLLITGVTITGTNSGDFTITTSPASSVAADESTTLVIQFDPSALGSRTATINIANNDADEATYNFDIQGYGYTPSDLIVYNTTTPSAANGVYTHQGVLNGQYEYWRHSSGSYYIYRKAPDELNYKWIIDSDTDISTYLFTDCGTNEYSPITNSWIASIGTGSPNVVLYVAGPEIIVLGNSTSITNANTTTSTGDHTHFGTAEVGSGSVTRTFTIQNAGGTNLQLTGSSPYVTISGANASDYTVTAIPTTPITAGNSTTFQITFTPLGEGSRTATVSIANNDSDENPFTFSIKGGGVYAKGLTVSGVTDYTNVNGNYTYQGITDGFAIWVHTSGTYRIYSHLYPSPENRYWCIDTDMDPDNGTCFTTTSYNYNPSPVGVTSLGWTYGGTIDGHAFHGVPVVVYYASEINIQGNGVSITSGDATPSTDDYTDFGSVLTTSGNTSHSFTIQNSGVGSLYLTGSPKVAISGTNASDFTVTTQPTSPVDATSGTKTFTVQFDPSAKGVRTATISIVNDDSDENPYTFSIQGTGLAVPTVTTQAVSNIGSTNAIGNGNITDLGNPNPTAYGICWGTSADPTISNSKVDKGAASATGAFTAQFTGLTPGTTYHTRAFATNSVGTVYGDDVQFTATATLTAPGNALNFDGTNDYVSVSNIASQNFTEITVEMWVYSTLSGADQKIIGDADNSTPRRGFCLGISDQNKLYPEIFNSGSTNVTSSETVPLNQWVHIAFTWKKGDYSDGIKGYINGKQVISTATVNNSMDNSNSLTIGSAPWFREKYFRGKMDEVRIWNIVRSEAEIQSDMLTPISTGSGLLCSFNFDEGTAGGTNTAGSTMLPDLTGNGNNGTLTNFALTGTASNWVESYAMVVPTAIAASSITASGFTANWTAPSVGIVNSYKLYVATDEAFSSMVAGYNPQTVASTSTTTAVTGLSANTTYYYRVCAYKTSDIGEGARSNTRSAKTLLLPTTTTQAVTSISITTATGNGTITDLGYPNPTAHGVCWNTSGTPTIAGSKTDNGAKSSTGAFTASITGLTANTTYHVRAFATNDAGTVYGDEVDFTTLTAGTFTGATNNDWATATNWAGGSVPTAATDVTIPSGKSPEISVTTEANCKNLTVSGSLIIKSTSLSTGSLIISGTSSGSVSCERYMTGNKWHMVSPIATGGSISTFIQLAGNAIPLSGSNYAMMDYNETANTWNSYFTSSTSGSFTAGQGYGLRRSSDGVVTFIGTLASGTMMVNITKEGTEGWNLIGNPYSSSIYMNASANGTYNFLKTNASYLDASYACVYVWDVDSRTYKILGNSSYSGRDLSINVFAPGQAFFIKAASAGTIEFNKDIQVHQTGSTLKSTDTSWPGICLQAASASASTSTIITFNGNMTNGLDPTYDAGLLRGTNGLSLYTRLVEDNGVDFAVQCLPGPTDGLIVPIGLESNTSGEVTFSMERTGLADHLITLEDRQLGVTKAMATPEDRYVATVQSGDPAYGRFFLRFNLASSVVNPNIELIKSWYSDHYLLIEGVKDPVARVELYDIQGRKLLESRLESIRQNKLSVIGLNDGIYLIHILSGGKMQTGKIAVVN